MELTAISPPGGYEGLIILVVILVLFGAKRLPDIGKGLGKGIKEFRSAAKGLGEEDDEGSAPAPKAPEKPSDH